MNEVETPLYRNIGQMNVLICDKGYTGRFIIVGIEIVITQYEYFDVLAGMLRTCSDYEYTRNDMASRPYYSIMKIKP